MESEKSGFVNKMSEIWKKMQVKYLPPLSVPGGPKRKKTRQKIAFCAFVTQS